MRGLLTSDANMSLRPARSIRAIEDIADQIREQLRSGHLRPGQRLPPERELAKQLGVGRNTVREAMTMLEVAGLVERRLGSAGGAFITNSNSKAVAERISDGMMLGRISLKANDLPLSEAKWRPLASRAAKATMCGWCLATAFERVSFNARLTSSRVPDDSAPL
ncbi:FadR/GntR family transcriptional regulator [Bradyrhizobium commune]|uniref:Winged helix-turn-helix transcriptional regulator n=1 Tax=Bradyrhizobium commune TaxID=83627 RepID=A0A7S9GXD0_9BRAD|nr:winged helix-turn-helix domain-containing protein [Bradyrhizobium commune]QPF88621.1 winged helix-turn-helix transcriptional regulator [Bradyrhizobium commune]